MNDLKQLCLTILGAVVGGFIGYYGVGWIARQGFYAMILPGGLLGLGASFGQSRSVALAAVCGIAATLLGLYAEWSYFPFIEDGSLGYFINHIGDLRPITLIMIALGGLLGFWLPFRNAQYARLADRR